MGDNIKFLLINSPVERIIEEYDVPAYPHLGLAYIATHLIKNGVHGEVIDCKFEKIDLPALLSKIRVYIKEKKLVIGFTAMTHEIERVAYVAQEVKRLLPQSRIVLGGVHVTALPEETLREFEVFDMGILGEGESTSVQLMQCLSEEKPLNQLDGVVYKKNGTIVCNPRTKWISNLDEIGYPDWNLFPKAREYPINIGRGCPIPCIFCMRASGTESRFRSVENIIEELSILKNSFQPRMIRFFGDDFCSDKQLTRFLLDKMIDMDLDLKWQAGMRVSNIDIGLLRKMKIAGCQHFEIGVESGNEDMLKVIKKGISLKKVEEVVKMAKDVGLDCWCYFILGHPNETWQTAMDTINFLCKINPTNAAIGIMVPYPGTQIWEMTKRGEGGYRMLSRDWKDFNKQVGNALELENLNRRQLEFLQLYGYIKMFLANFRFIDFIRFSWNYRRLGFKLIKKLCVHTIRRIRQ